MDGDNGKDRTLLPCPFCGSPAVLESFEVRKGYAATVGCTGCLAQMPSIAYDDKDRAERETAAAWNRRA